MVLERTFGIGRSSELEIMGTSQSSVVPVFIQKGSFGSVLEVLACQEQLSTRRTHANTTCYDGTGSRLAHPRSLIFIHQPLDLDATFYPQI